MTPSRQMRLPVQPPAVAAPPRFGERRVRYRRAADQLAHEETLLLARALDILAGEASAEQRLAGLLDLLARTVGARRAAVLSDGLERRCAVSLVEGESPAEAEALAAWLDAASPRTRAERAATGPAAISIAVRREDDAIASAVAPPAGRPSSVDGAVAPGDDHHYACLEIPSTGSVVLGFDFAEPAGQEAVHDRLPPNLARHAAVALALVTEQLATERELATLRGRDAERTRFVSTVAHELRTPLTGLGGYLDLILNGRVGDPAVERDFLERSQGIVGSMADLVGDLLEISRLESGTLELEQRPFSLAEVGSRVLQQLEPIAIESGVELRSDLPPRLRAATGDRRRVEQVLVNLVANALKFTAFGGSVELAGWFDGPVALIAIRDDGVGIAAEDRVRIFERFYRMTGHERITGTGLGLPIARDLARAMGGELDVTSVPDAGSSFILVLPGPASVPQDVMEATLDRALGAEEIRLEERSVIRALQAAGRPTSLPAPRALPTSRHVDADGPVGERPRPRLVDQLKPSQPIRLRSIDGAAGRPDTPSSA